MDGKDPETGRFLPKNEFWKVRSTHGRTPRFETAEMLADACEQYFQWVADNPLYEMKPFAYQGVVIQEPVAKMRAMTIGGLCLFIGVTQQHWQGWKREGSVSYRPDFVSVIGNVEDAIRQQKFEGAAADLLNANIIARDLGLADKSEVTGKDGGPIETKEMSDLELARKVAFLLAAGINGDGNG